MDDDELLNPAPVPAPRTASGPRRTIIPGGLARRSSAREWRLDRLAPLAPNAWMRYDTVVRLLPAEADTALEIGCGRGAFGVRLAQLYQYLGIEPDAASCAVAQGRVRAAGRGEVRNISSDALDGQQFDLVCAFEVLEHIQDDRAALAAWMRLVRPGGWLLLSVPAGPNRLGPWDDLVGHFRRYDPQGLTCLLAEAGCARIQTQLYGFPLGYPLESARNMIARRRRAIADQSPAARTAASGRQLQPSGRMTGVLSHCATLPFRVLEQAFPYAGTGLVALARTA
jgi:SAM-dependent methyltransferase